MGRPQRHRNGGRRAQAETPACAHVARPPRAVHCEQSFDHAVSRSGRLIHAEEAFLHPFRPSHQRGVGTGILGRARSRGHARRTKPGCVCCTDGCKTRGTAPCERTSAGCACGCQKRALACRHNSQEILMLTLIHKPQTRSASIVWLLEEIGAPYEKKIVTLRSQDGTGERDPSNPHPHGKVPALVHDGHTIFETSAIALYLTDLFPDAKLGPKVGDANRGEYLSWLAYRSGVLEPAFMERRFGIKHVYGAMGWAPPE